MRKLYYFLLIFLIILILIGFVIYIYSFSLIIKIDTNFINITQAFVTVIGILIALFRKELLNIIFYPKIEIVGWNNNIQTPQPIHNTPTQGQTRLLIKNKGKASAHDVEIQVTKIIDPDGIVRNDFLPVPLSWTHDGRSRKKLHINQECFLDFCRRDDISKQVEGPKLVLAAGAGVFNYETICEGISELELTIFERHGIKKWKVVINYILNEPTVKIDLIKPL